MADVGLIKVTRNGQVTLPANVRRRLRVEEGDYMEVRVACLGSASDWKVKT
jgi:AbrB family looped-hinge helix DNA binding protein